MSSVRMQVCFVPKFSLHYILAKNLCSELDFMGLK